MNTALGPGGSVDATFYREVGQAQLFSHNVSSEQVPKGNEGENPITV